MQANFAKQYQLKNDIWALHQKNISIQEFYFAMTDLWDQLALTELTESILIIGIEDEGDTKVKDKESRDI
jgi:hypothetical protein